MSLTVQLTAECAKCCVSCHLSLLFRLMWKFIFPEQEAFCWFHARLKSVTRPISFFATPYSYAGSLEKVQACMHRGSFSSLVPLFVRYSRSCYVRTVISHMGNATVYRRLNVVYARGLVERVGEGVEAVKVGDLVATLTVTGTHGEYRVCFEIGERRGKGTCKNHA